VQCVSYGTVFILYCSTVQHCIVPNDGALIPDKIILE
jgi:hypothetical protein